MITPRELISVCRQIGGMMEAGVDILRITRVLRSQTDNARLLDLYDQIDHELTMGRGLADVLARASDVFSPFAISLVRQGEERNNLAGAFLRIADFLEKEVDLQNGAPANRSTRPADQNPHASALSSQPSTSARPGLHSYPNDAAITVLWSRSVWLLSAWMLAVGVVLWMSESGALPLRWRVPLALFSCAAIGVVAAWKSGRAATSSSLENEPEPDVATQSVANFSTLEESPLSHQSTLDRPQYESGGQSHAESWEERTEIGQSTLGHSTRGDDVDREESVKDGAETDASALLDRFKNRVPRRDAPEEEFD